MVGLLGAACRERSLTRAVGPEQATSSEVTLLMVNRKTFGLAIGDLVTKKRGELLPFLTKLSIFADMDEYEMGMVRRMGMHMYTWACACTPG